MTTPVDNETSRPVGFNSPNPKQPLSSLKTIEQTQKNYLSVRFWIVLAMVILTYSLFVWTLFWQEKLLLSAGLFCILFIELIFLAIDLRSISKKKIWLILLGIGLIIWLFMPNPVWQLAVALWISLFTIGFLLPYLKSYFSNVRKITWINYFTSGGYLFTLMMSILFGFAVLGLNSQFPFQCEQISGWSDKIIETSTNPFQLDLFREKNDNNDLVPLSTGTGELSLENIEEEPELKKLFGKLKTNIMDGFIDTQKSINTKVCEAIVGQLEKVYQNPIFQIGAIFGMYLLFYGVIRLLVWIVTIIGYIFFWITKLFGAYRTGKKREEVEDIE